MATGNDTPLRIPPDVIPGAPVRAAGQNAIHKALRRLDGEVRRRTPRPSLSHGIRRTGGGFQVFHRGLEREGEVVVGFMPVARGLGPDPIGSPLTPGVGVAAGYVLFVDPNGEATRIMPTLGGTALDAATPPRSSLSAGDYEMWITGGSSSATVTIQSAGTGNPATGDWQFKVSEFAVALPAAGATQIPRIEITTQYLARQIYVFEDPTAAELHPFQIAVEDVGATWTATVAPGDVYIATPYEDTTGRSIFGGFGAIQVTETDVTGLADDTTYGIWLELTIGTVNVTNANGEGVNMRSEVPSGVWDINEYTSATAASQAGALIDADTDVAYILIGTVVIASGVVSILQNLRGHFTYTPLHTLADLISSDADNAIVQGADEGLWVDATP